MLKKKCGFVNLRVQCRSMCVYLLTALKLTHYANEHAAHVSLCVCVGLGVQAESVQNAGEETDVVQNLPTVPKPHQS